MGILYIVILWIGIAAFIIGLCLFFVCGKHIDYNKEIEEKNQQLKKSNFILQGESNKLHSEIEFLQKQKQQIYEEQGTAAENYFNILDLTYGTKESEFDTKLNNLYADYQREREKLDREYLIHKQQMRDALQCYCDLLDEDYKEKEAEYENHYRCLKQSYDNLQDICIKDLEKIQNTRVAAIEAQLREAEIAQKLDFFCLHLTPAEESTIALIEELKPRLPEPRVLCMLVWQTFYQKKMNSLCLNILRKATPICGIYKITNRKTGLCYIGQSTDVAKRWKDHAKCGLGIDTPAQNKLYKAMLKDGLTNFTFELLEECERDLLNEKEKFYIDLYQACDYGYNSTSGNK